MTGLDGWPGLARYTQAMDELTERGDARDFDPFARYYDLEFATYTADIDLFEQFARRAGPRLLELGCGTGRVLVPLCQRGLAVTGVDVSSAMLDVARRKASDAGVLHRARLVRGDIRDLRALGDGQYDLAFSAINSFLHLETLEDQRAALRAVAHLLRRDGLFVADLLATDPVILAAMDGRLVHDAVLRDPATGERIDKFTSSIVDYAEQRIESTFYYDRLGQDGALQRTVTPFVLRYLGRFELELLLGEAGFTDVRFYGSYDLEPFGADSERMLVTAVR